MKILPFFLVLLCMLSVVDGQEYEKLAQTGFQFLSVPSDARAASLAGAVTSHELKSGSLFFNPAGMANLNAFMDVSISQNKWIADINYNTASLAISPANGRYGVFGLSAMSVDYGDLQGTRVAATELGYIDTEVFSPSALAVGFGYAHALSDRFSVGGQVKVAHQDLGENLVLVKAADTTDTIVKNRLTPMAFDFGTLFKTGIKSLAFGMSVRNFSREVKYEEEAFQLPLVFQMGISADVFDFYNPGGPEQSLYMSIDATHFRSHPEQLIIGLDYTIMKFLSLRGGYVTNNDEDAFSFGLGVSYFGVTIDYAYTPFGVFDHVQRFTARFSI